jgi:acetyl esterase/lipase
VIVCPGGGFFFLALEGEGTPVAERLRARGTAAFVLKHRLMDTGATEAEFHKSMLRAALLKAVADRLTAGERPVLPEDVMKFSTLAVADGRQAIKVVREHAGEWGIKPDRIGIMGFSSGGVVATGVATEHDAACRPNYAASLYSPVLGSVKVPKDAPPLFICCASDDPLVPSKDSIRLYSAWKAAGKSAELHIYAKGSHGLPIDTWIDRFSDWLGQQGLLKPPGNLRRGASRGGKNRQRQASSGRSSTNVQPRMRQSTPKRSSRNLGTEATNPASALACRTSARWTLRLTRAGRGDRSARTRPFDFSSCPASFGRLSSTE